jgi:phosphoenolpyruvate carboxykinase (GTP)
MLYNGCLKGRSMYVILSLGPVGSDIAKFGIEFTDLFMLFLNLRISSCWNKVLEYVVLR